MSNTSDLSIASQSTKNYYTFPSKDASLYSTASNLSDMLPAKIELES